MDKIRGKTCIPEDEFVFKFSRSSGPGGQNINKLNTKVTVLFDVANSVAFTSVQKKLILKKLKTRTDKKGRIAVSAQKYRTQKANRKAATDKLLQLLKEAIRKKPLRKKTVAPQWAHQKRLDQKKRRSLLKQNRATTNLVSEKI